MTDIDLIKQALEYLEDNQHHIADHERHAYLMLYNDCINALKARLSDPMREVQRLGQEIEQEPVAWISPSGALYRTRYHAVANAEQSLTPLYTHPPQRTWVDLTDREMMDAIDIDDSPMEMGRKIEAKLKEKNT